ncbi:hypothetical protein TCAL_03600, partial [Tigriopus californicus]|eukprot:TCALIF_03600-PA protein Name:"Similar to SPBC1306.02 Uncharacterized WD repeat-containing protein C1306.02 (Schizosaccharomyces pombe (strain 972 / ATCC 24843))" AED:0.07 eAED:0.10 QI:49/0/0/0.66/0.5/0.33/3/0/987
MASDAGTRPAFGAMTASCKGVVRMGSTQEDKRTPEVVLNAKLREAQKPWRKGTIQQPGMSWLEKDLACRVGALYQSQTHGPIWAGIGGTLIRVPSGSTRPLRVFQHDTYIHRILPSPSEGATAHTIWVYGGKRLAVVDTLEGRVLIQIQAPDWIQHVWASPQDSTKLWVLTSHNRVHLMAFDSGQILSTWVCQERCLLYAGLLVPSMSLSTGAPPTVLSGTVFQTILVWQPQWASPVWHRLTGHEGVIFGLEFHAGRQLICSTSDDRTARVWRVLFDTPDQDWHRCQIQAWWVFSGHTARVFRSLILSDMIVIGGEDSRLTFWRQGRLVRSESQAHNGSPVWALAASFDQADSVISGGQDGSIRRWSLDPDPVAVELAMPSFNARDFYPRIVRRYLDWKICVAGNNSIVALRSSHSVSRDAQSITLVHEFPDQPTLAALVVFQNAMYAATNGGQLIEYTLKEEDQANPALSCQLVTSVQVFDGKVFSLQVVSYDKKPLVLACGPQGLVKGFQSANSSVKSFQLPSPKQSKVEQGQWVNCASIHESLGLLVLGDRHGNILGYLLDELLGSNAVFTIIKAHQQRGVSHLSMDQKYHRLTSIGRDGLIKTYDINAASKAPNETACSRLPLDSLEMLVETNLQRNGRNVGLEIILGFHGSDFVLYSLEEHRVLTRIPCGGSHRSWIFTPNANQSELAFIKDRKLVLKSHISSVKAIDVTKINAHKRLMVSVGGRAQIKVWLISSGLAITEKASYMLKGNDKRRKKTWRDARVIHDTETRFIDVAIDPRNHTNIFVGGSDCVLRKFELSDDFSRIDLVIESEPLHHSILSVQVDPELGLVVTTSNDGFVRTFTTEELILVRERMLTKSGLNVISKPYQDQNCFAGSDGGEIIWIDYPDLNKHCVFPQCQAAQINGIHLLRETNELITSSVDQRISLWSIMSGSDSDGPTLQLKSQVCTDIADAQCLEIWPKGRDGSSFATIGGEGMAIFELK